jgi:hypothetical protein
VGGAAVDGDCVAVAVATESDGVAAAGLDGVTVVDGIAPLGSVSCRRASLCLRAVAPSSVRRFS